MVLSKNMLEQVITIFLSDGFVSSMVSNVDVLAGTFNKYLSGLSNLRMASIILMLLAFVLFLFLIVVLYVKSIIAFLKSDTVKAKKKNRQDEDFFEELEEDSEERINERNLEQELEKELERDLEQSRAERILNEQRELQQKKKEEEQLYQREEQKELEEKETKQKATMNAKSSFKKDFQVDLDWKKGKLNEMEIEQATISQDKMQYQQSNKELNELLGLVIDMLGRGVDDLKISQTVMYRNQGLNSEEDIIQTISAVRDFIALSINGRFGEIRRGNQLPDEATALYHMAHGDTTYSLALLEALMDANIERTAAMTSGPKRDEVFIDTSNQACTFGTLAAITDVHLATGAFELAIELAPKNINAWNRVGDMYHRVGSNNQSIWAYQNVLNMADEEINIAQVANANKMLSQYYYEQGNNLQAAKLYNSSKQYYDSLGINRRLDRQEIEIIEIIESRRKDELGDTINKILGNKEFRQYSYA